MVKEIVKDTFFLGQKSTPATKVDMQIAVDLSDTLKANEKKCVGMAANMIGYQKNIIIVNMGFTNVVMFNPVITKRTGLYQTEEGCLSLTGIRKTDRYKTIEVRFQDINWKTHRQKFSGHTAQIIQHEVDHLFGKII